MTAIFGPDEYQALAVAMVHVYRGENPPVSTTRQLVEAMNRLIERDPVIAERYRVKQYLLDSYEQMNEEDDGVRLDALLHAIDSIGRRQSATGSPGSPGSPGSLDELVVKVAGADEGTVTG